MGIRRADMDLPMPPAPVCPRVHTCGPHVCPPPQPNGCSPRPGTVPCRSQHPLSTEDPLRLSRSSSATPALALASCTHALAPPPRHRPHQAAAFCFLPATIAHTQHNVQLTACGCGGVRLRCDVGRAGHGHSRRPKHPLGDSHARVRRRRKARQRRRRRRWLPAALRPRVLLA